MLDRELNEQQEEALARAIAVFLSLPIEWFYPKEQQDNNSQPKQQDKLDNKRDDNNV